MSAAAADGEHRHEIIIVKRHGGHDDDGHHGGVWKIAFADFMTAMMCFFLVMWLINAANEQTKAAVASYFNPVKLVDRNSSAKGLQDLGEGPSTSGSTAENVVEAPDAGEAEDAQESKADNKQKASAEKADDSRTPDEKLFANPYAVLSEIAQNTDVMQNMSDKGDGGASLAGPATGASGGTSYRDPFAPDFWSQQVAATQAGEDGTPEKLGAGFSEEIVLEAVSPQGSLDKPDPLARPEDPAKASDEPVQAPKAGTPPTIESKPAEASKPEETKPGEPSARAVAAAREIRQQLAEVFKPGEKLADGLSVVATDRGVKISVTDQLDFGMFEIGSALPRREMILAMEKIGRIIEQRPGAVAIGGHTDGRPFRSAGYDNWRLSSARAQSAYYMLVRAGLDEKRINEVAGHADRELRDKDRPLAASNRRIDILLEVEG